MAEEDGSDDAGGLERGSEDDRESEMELAQVVARSEKVSKKALKGVKKGMKKPKDLGGGDRHPRDAPAQVFKTMFDDYMHGMTPEAIHEKYQLIEETMRRRLPEFELAKRRFIEGLRERGDLPQDAAQPAPASQTTGQVPPASPGSSGALRQPPTTPPTTPNPGVGTQNHPGTNTVPAGNAMTVAGVVRHPRQRRRAWRTMLEDASQRRGGSGMMVETIRPLRLLTTDTSHGL